MTAWTATHLHLALVGLPASAMVADARAVASVTLASPALFELPGHGFAGAAALAGPEKVRLAARNGVTLDTAISATTYYTVGVTPGDPDFFTLISPLGAPLVLNGDGAGEPSALENIIPKIDIIMSQWTSVLISSAKAYAGPWNPADVPAWAPLLVAHLAAPTVCNILRVASARFDIATVVFNTVWAWDRMKHLEAGEPFDDGSGNFDATNTPDNAAFAAQDRPPERWRTGYA
jgi:hypothetical protein